MRQIIILLMVLILIPIASAQEIKDYKVEATVEGPKLYEKVAITIVNNHDYSLKEISYPFNGMIEDLKSYDPQGGLESDTNYIGDKTYVKVFFRGQLMPGGEYTVNHEFQSPQKISEYNKTFLLSTAYSLLANVKNFELTIRLPEGMGIVEGEANIVPKPEEVTTDGRQIILRWTKKNPTEFRVFVRYEPLVVKTTPPPTTLSPTTLPPTTLPPTTQPSIIFPVWYAYLPILSAVLIILLILLISYIMIEKWGLKLPFSRGRDLSEKIDILKEDEQEILRIIMESDGIVQRKIQDLTGFSKAKVSKILSELEKRGAIRKEQIGRRNRIYLTEKLKES
ncbi:MAG: helix-turn-helix transcriptional regulator [Candidatus Hydrothermarchaeales archaeon]